MLRAALRIAAKDVRLVLVRGGGLAQALLLGLLLVFVFSLAQAPGEVVGPRAAAVIFWLASAFCQVLACNMLYSLEEDNRCREGLILMPAPVQAVWLGKGIAALAVILGAQALFLPALVVFLGQTFSGPWPLGLLALFLTDVGLAALGSLLGALAQGQAARESLLSVIVFPLLVPVLLAGIRVGAAALGGGPADDARDWLGLAAAFDALFLAAGLTLFPYVFTDD